MMQALAGKPITIYGDGSQTRSFCYVDDMIDAFIRLMDSPEDITGPMNLGNPHELSMLEIARRIVALTGSSSEIAFAPLPMDDPCHRQPDIRFAIDTLGWEPETGLDEGLNRTTRYFRRFTQEAAVRSDLGLPA
jgi:UDP-glucuronate decarboxylase